MADVMIADIVSENVSMICAELSSAAMNVYKLLQIAMASVCMVHDAPIQRVLEDVSSPRRI